MFPLMKIHIASVFTRCGFSLPLLPAEKYALIFFFYSWPLLFKKSN